MFLSKKVEGLDITSDEIAYQHMNFMKSRPAFYWISSATKRAHSKGDLRGHNFHNHESFKANRWRNELPCSIKLIG